MRGCFFLPPCAYLGTRELTACWAVTCGSSEAAPHRPGDPLPLVQIIRASINSVPDGDRESVGRVWINCADRSALGWCWLRGSAGQRWPRPLRVDLRAHICENIW